MSTCPAHANNSLGNIQKWNIIVVVVYISSVVYYTNRILLEYITSVISKHVFHVVYADPTTYDEELKLTDSELLIII